MRVRIDATPHELETKGNDLIKALVRSIGPLNADLAESLEKALPKKEPELKFKALQEIHEITAKEYEKMLERMYLDIATVIEEAVDNPTLHKSDDRNDSDFLKAGEERPNHKYIRREGTPGH